MSGLLWESMLCELKLVMDAGGFLPGQTTCLLVLQLKERLLWEYVLVAIDTVANLNLPTGVETHGPTLESCCDGIAMQLLTSLEASEHTQPIGLGARTNCEPMAKRTYLTTPA